MVESDVHSRQILTTKVDPRAVRVKIHHFLLTLLSAKNNGSFVGGHMSCMTLSHKCMFPAMEGQL